MHAVTIFDNDNLVGAIPLVVEDGYEPCGIEGNQVYFENGNGKSRICEIPLYDQAPCVIEKYDVQTNTGLETNMRIIKHKQQGTHMLHLSIVGGGGFYWVIAQATQSEF